MADKSITNLGSEHPGGEKGIHDRWEPFVHSKDTYSHQLSGIVGVKTSYISETNLARILIAPDF